MGNALRICIVLGTIMSMTPAWCSEVTNDTLKECINEPVFEGKVCTEQRNRDAKIGVILIHGLDGSVDDWENTIPALAKDFHVVAFDLPGFGKSDKGSQDYTPTRYARLAQFLANRYFPDKPFHIVGHSMGGAIALRFASQQPQRFRRLVLIDAAGILHPMVITKYQAGALVENASNVKQTRGLAERISGRLMEKADGLHISPFDIINSTLGREMILQGGPSKIAALGLAEEDFGYAISTVTAPTLVLWGEQDPIAPLRTGQVLAARMKQARLEIIRDAGHEPARYQPEQTNALIENHLLSGDTELTKSFEHTSAPTTFSSKRDGSCVTRSGMVFEGDYRTIDLRDCSNVTIRNARIGRLNVLNSRVSISNSDILGNDVGLYTDNSEVTMTNGNISGSIAIDTTLSRLDLAGVHVSGTQEAIKGTNSKLTFSVCRVSSPRMDEPIHDFRNMIDDML